MSAETSKLLMIGIDAAEPRLVEQWMADGSLPNLAALRVQGAYARLASSADWLVGSPWPTFYTGTNPGDHGYYHYLAWRADRMAQERPTQAHLPLAPFWRDLARHGRKVIAVDVPQIQAPPEGFDGIEVSGWASHDMLVPPYIWPPRMTEWVRRAAGRAPRADEVYRSQPLHELLALRDEQRDATLRLADLSRVLLAEKPWDLFLVVLGAPHRCGHKLWDESGVRGGVPAEQRSEFADALHQVYRACDEAVGRICEAAGADVTVLAFSVHGMGANSCRSDLLPEMLGRVLAGGPPSAPPRSPGMLARVRKLVPDEWRHAVKQRLPLEVQDRLTSYWRRVKTDWPATRAFCVVADLQGYVRINLKGREAAGIVQPGREYDALCEEIVAGLQTFVDADTGEPVVRDAARCDVLYPGGARLGELPDLSFRWATTPVSQQRAIVSPRFGTIELPTPGQNENGRSGNHRPEGFLIASGVGFRAGSTFASADILDLAPTAYARLGLPQPPALRGRSL